VFVCVFVCDFVCAVCVCVRERETECVHVRVHMCTRPPLPVGIHFAHRDASQGGVES